MQVEEGFYGMIELGFGFGVSERDRHVYAERK
jgi:hypothetical protein